MEPRVQATKSQNGQQREVSSDDVVKQEEEVKLAEMEVQIRQMVLEVTKPTVERAVKLQNHCEHLQTQLNSQGEILSRLTADVAETQKNLDVVSQFKMQLNEFWESQRQLELKLADHTKDVLAKVENTEQTCKGLLSTTARLSKSIDRNAEDSEFLRMDLAKMNSSVELGIKKCKDFLESEMRRIDFGMDQMKAMHHALCNEIWGPEEPDDLGPPSLRRFDMQIRKLQRTTKEVLYELKELRLLDVQLQKVTTTQGEHGERLVKLEKDTDQLESRIEKYNKDTKRDLKQTANLMAAYSANLMHDVRGTFTLEVKQLQDIHQEIQRFLKQTEDTVRGLSESLASSGRYLESSMREVRTDLEGLETRRKHDKLGLEENMLTLKTQVFSSVDTSQKMVGGLEHVISVLGMCLQSQRMDLALGIQDYVDRKEVNLVGTANNLKKGSVTSLEALKFFPYSPSEILFQGNKFERPQMLALAEKLVFSAQEALINGPLAGGPQKGPGDDIFKQLQNPQGMRHGYARPASQSRRTIAGGQIFVEGKGKDDRATTAGTVASKPMTADSACTYGSLNSAGGSNPLRLPPMAGGRAADRHLGLDSNDLRPLTAR
eukprot:TRINITY_DN32007_c0_g1_i1.p1 TRINITY_DN32007_c0_g1~~TRINITY_DN32007_c0_g1_i1.p1  ORF type:complete len:603 (+),score=115.69 TRINITY_DN32007_c0_g1_i1:152-1960(+)